ncbi:ferredoxin-dependent bilin reductase [Nitzschia inconspicua]|uniref:Ferredoxin-dependent bilin reductase n=1 Tax=Nitzschia inconspicua TaxID=303405 RepID=A0A9K3LPK5_9STRA|nr:ferredoxin-dependent bilin reductase [Nitzschia inconspicua]
MTLQTSLDNNNNNNNHHNNNHHDPSSGGGGSSSGSVFRPFADYCIQTLNETGWVQPMKNMPQDLQHKVGTSVLPSSLYHQRQPNLQYQQQQQNEFGNDNTVVSNPPAVLSLFDDYRVHITVTALEAKSECTAADTFAVSPIQYARIVLMETLPSNSNSSNSNNNNNHNIISTINNTTIQNQVSSSHPYHGLHALNIVLFPNQHTTLPIWGVSMATTVPNNGKLPTMITLDAQPMTRNATRNAQYAQYFHDWYVRHVRNNPNLPWGGPLRPTVQPFLSDHVLWSKLGAKKHKDTTTTGGSNRNRTIGTNDSTYGKDNNDNTSSSSSSTTATLPSPLEIIQQDVWDAYKDHLDIYLDMIQQECSSTDTFLATMECSTDTTVGAIPPSNNSTQSHHQHSRSYHQQQQYQAYCDYWRYNEPERSTLNTLFGKEWTERLLWQVMFPLTATNNQDTNHSNYDSVTL